MRHWEDLLTWPAPEVELELWGGAVSKAGLELNDIFPVGGVGVVEEKPLNKFDLNILT